MKHEWPYRKILAAALLLPGFFVGPALADPQKGLGTAERNVIQGTSRGTETLRGVYEKVPDPAKPAIQRSIEQSRTGQREALEGLQRGRQATPDGPPAGIGGPPRGVGGGPPAGVGSRGRR